MATKIHPTAIIDPTAELADGVEIGAYAIIDGDVTIGEGTSISHHAFIASGARIGKECVIHHSAVVANVPQDLKFTGSEKTYVEIGDHTTIREFATIHRATVHTTTSKAGTHDSITKVGSHCLIMAYSHIAHDCLIGDHVILSNAVQVAGHCTIGSFVTIGGLTGVHQFSMIGAYSMVGAALMLTKDAPPYSLIADEPPRFVGVNKIGLERRGFTKEAIKKIRDAYKLIYFSGLNFTDAMSTIEANRDLNIAEVQVILDFYRNSDRGVIGG